MCAAAAPAAAAVCVISFSKVTNSSPEREKKKKNLKIFSTGICCWRWTKGEEKKEKLGIPLEQKKCENNNNKRWMDGVGQAK